MTDSIARRHATFGHDASHRGFTGEFLCVRHEVFETLRQVISSKPLFGQDLRSVPEIYRFLGAGEEREAVR